MESLKISQAKLIQIVNGYKVVSLQGKVFANSYIARLAKELNVDKTQLKQAVMEENKNQINNKNQVLHYHRTSTQNAIAILESGYFYNRKHLKERGVDISNLQGSSSQDVQFSCDRFDKNGNLSELGFSLEDSLGASASDVVFVMGPNLINEETYDCFEKYPTVEKASIKDSCVAILAKDNETQNMFNMLIKGLKLQIPVITQQEYNREDVLKTINKKEELKEYLNKNCVLAK